MERPPKKYVCEKCGYLGNTSEHEGCDYLAWTTGEQLYIDQLEAELAALRASPASAPEGWKLVPVEPTEEMLFKGHMEIDFDRNAQNTLELEHPSQTDDGGTSIRTDMTDAWGAMLASAPTPPSTEDRKDAERYRDGWTHPCNALCMEIELWIDRCPHCGRPAPKAPAMQEDKP